MIFTMHDRVIVVGGAKGSVCNVGKGEFTGYYSVRVDGSKEIVQTTAENMHPLTPWASSSRAGV